jgi:hypothetical protein
MPDENEENKKVNGEDPNIDNKSTQAPDPIDQAAFVVVPADFLQNIVTILENLPAIQSRPLLNAIDKEQGPSIVVPLKDMVAQINKENTEQ